MKKVFSVLTWLVFLYALGTVGAIEQEMVPLGIGTVRAFLGIAAFGLFSDLAGLTYPSRKRKSRPRSSSPKGGKRKCSMSL